MVTYLFARLFSVLLKRVLPRGMRRGGWWRGWGNLFRAGASTGQTGSRLPVVLLGEVMEGGIVDEGPW